MAVTLNYVPHAAQREIHEARGYRFRTVCTGRRFGKTLCPAAELLDRGGGDPVAEPAGGRRGADLARKGCEEVKGEVGADGECKAGTAAIEL